MSRALSRVVSFLQLQGLEVVVAIVPAPWLSAIDAFVAADRLTWKTNVGASFNSIAVYLDIDRLDRCSGRERQGAAVFT